MVYCFSTAAFGGRQEYTVDSIIYLDSDRLKNASSLLGKFCSLPRCDVRLRPFAAPLLNLRDCARAENLFRRLQRGMSKADIDARVKEAAGILGIGELLGRRPKDMSGGQRQRVAVGRAIVRHPRVFLFDEPLSNLDAKLRVQTRREIARLHQQLSATMLYVTHDQVEAMTLGDRIVVLEGGHVKQIDTPMNLYERPRNTLGARVLAAYGVATVVPTDERFMRC